jgi:ArsR family transcriptional regulator
LGKLLWVTVISTDVNMDAISNLVNIEMHRYHRRIMAKSSDPDIQLLAALADPTRLEILRQLAGSAEVCACDFTECCGVSQPTVSHHLKVLRDAGVVTSERRGSWVFYRIAPNLIERLGGIAQSLVPGGLIPAAALLAKPGVGRAPRASATTA